MDENEVTLEAVKPPVEVNIVDIKVEDISEEPEDKDLEVVVEKKKKKMMIIEDSEEEKEEEEVINDVEEVTAGDEVDEEVIEEEKKEKEKMEMEEIEVEKVEHEEKKQEEKVSEEKDKNAATESGGEPPEGPSEVVLHYSIHSLPGV